MYAYHTHTHTHTHAHTGKITKHTPGINISSGIGWNLDNTVMYYVDSLPRKVYTFDYNEQEGNLYPSPLMAILVGVLHDRHKTACLHVEVIMM